MKKKSLILLALISTISNAKPISITWDIYPNPHLSEPSLTANFVSQLRNKNISSMESMIQGECNQYNEYLNLSIANWKSAKYKSLTEVEQYSSQLITEYPYRQSQLLTFPFGIKTYLESEALIKANIYGNADPNFNVTKFRESMRGHCVYMATDKYIRILTSPKFASPDTILYAPIDETLKKYKGTFFNQEDINSPIDDLTPPNLAKKLDFNISDMTFANILINNDIRVNLPRETRWIDFKVASINTQSSFIDFMSQGGSNKKFASIGIVTKLLSLKTNHFENINLRNEQSVIKLVDDTLPTLDANIYAKVAKDFGRGGPTCLNN